MGLKRMNKKLAVVVPVKDREEYLSEFLKQVPEYLKSTNGIEDFIIVIAEQINEEMFSASIAKNIGASFALSIFKCDYIIFNDVDIIPIKNVDYGFKDNITICFMNFGSCKVPADAFIRTNGYNPNISGWGFEDTEFYDRLEAFGFDCERWDRSEESDEAVVIDLELRNQSPEEDRKFSRKYWRRDDDNGAMFISPSWQLKHYDKSVWFSEEIKKKNMNFVNSIYNMRLVRRIEYYKKHGTSSLDMKSVKAVTTGQIVRLKYDSRNVFRKQYTKG